MATLVDTGPLVALIDRSQDAHEKCVHALSSLSAPLVTTWPCLTEAMYFLGKSWRKQTPLWNLVEHGRLEIHALTMAETRRMRVLMERYQDVPMDLADASLVAAAETQELRRVFTLDSHFRIYRVYDKQSFEVVL